jgi:hypothetical protein
MNKTSDESAAELWRRRIESHRASGLSVRAWCRANDVHEHGFYWWRSRLGMSLPNGRSRRGVKAEAAGFAEVVVAPIATSNLTSMCAQPIRLRLSHERELILPASMPIEHVATLIRAIEGKPSSIERAS